MRSKIPCFEKEGQIAYKHDVGRFQGSLKTPLAETKRHFRLATNSLKLQKEVLGKSCPVMIYSIPNRLRPVTGAALVTKLLPRSRTIYSFLYVRVRGHFRMAPCFPSLRGADAIQIWNFFRWIIFICITERDEKMAMNCLQFTKLINLQKMEWP